MKFSKKNSIFKNLNYDLRQNTSLFLMLGIPLVILIVFSYIPLYGLQIAFKDYHILQNIWEADWVGLKYFKSFLEYYDFGKLLKNTILLNLYDLVLTPIPVVFALCINYCPIKKVKNIVQTVSIVPHFISLVVVCGLVTRFLSVDGIINEFSSLLGNDATNYLTKGELFRSIYVWSGAWQNAGYSAIIYISALSEVSVSQHEAAEMDGASIFQKIRYIDLPNILPIFAVNFVFKCGAMFSNNYEKVLLLQNNFNLQYSEVISTYTYEIAFKGIMPQYSLAMAIGIMSSIVNFMMLMIVKKITRKWERICE
ncbi:MAG: sugar ABC transporter permease [Clostridia bacterium]|nr:sugar ABC transporter permease [Clostridia bacterium]